MAEDTQRLITVYEARTAQFERAVKRMEGATSASMDKQAAAVEKLSSSFEEASKKTAIAGDRAAM